MHFFFTELLRLIILEPVGRGMICLTCYTLMQILTILFLALANTFIIVGILFQLPKFIDLRNAFYYLFVC